VRAGDPAAFDVLVRRYLSRAYAVAYRILGHREDAEDLVQDAFLSALQHIDSFDLSRPFWPWLSRIIVNRGLDLAASRSARSTDSLPQDVRDARPSPAESAEREEIRDEFARTLAGLPAKRRLVVQLFEVDGFSVAEIAKLLGWSVSKVKVRAHRARARLRRALGRFL
jgi:RNA polymerase sigma-70 factor (ECF subfamily)